MKNTYNLCALLLILSNLIIINVLAQPAPAPAPYEDKIHILDVWGEGRIDIIEGSSRFITGFQESININKYNQKISNGPNRGKDIPNLSAVSEYDNPRFDIRDNSVENITLMGAPITAGVSKEMLRVLSKTDGVIILYNPSQKDKQIFENIANGYGLFLNSNYALPHPFTEITITPAYAYEFVGPPAPPPSDPGTWEREDFKRNIDSQKDHFQYVGKFFSNDSYLFDDAKSSKGSLNDCALRCINNPECGYFTYAYQNEGENGKFCTLYPKNINLIPTSNDYLLYKKK